MNHNMKNKHIDPQDNSTTIIARATSGCCGGFHQTIAGVLLKSKEWKKWREYCEENLLYDVGETELIDAMSDEHFEDFIKYIKKIK